MSEDFRSSEALPKFGRCENPKIKCRMKKLFFSNVWNYHSSRKFLTKKSYLKTPGLENSRKIFRNLPKSSEIFRNRRKSSEITFSDRRAEYFSNMVGWPEYNTQKVTCVTPTVYFRVGACIFNLEVTKPPRIIKHDFYASNKHP